MSLSVCCFTQDPGERVYAILSLFRPVADEIVVVADSHVGPSDLAAYGAVADRLLRFRHDGTQRHHAWLRAQCTGDWILRIDGDEVPSAALLAQLPSLTSRPEVLQYWLPTRWVFPDREHWLDELPWWPDYHSRLLLNSSAQRFPGKAHTSAEALYPARYLEAPLYHLDGILNSWEERKAKAHRYVSFRPVSDVAAGGSIGTYYLPERRRDLRLAAVPPEDLELIDQVLDHSGAAYAPVAELPIVADEEIERFGAEGPLEPEAYRALIAPLERDWRMRAGECRPIFFAIRNDGTARWPWGLDEPPLIRVAYRWLDLNGRRVISETPRSGFPAPVDPGETCITSVIVTAPDSPGDYVLELDLVHEFERWFECEARFPTAVIDRVGPWRLPRDKLGAAHLSVLSRKRLLLGRLRPGSKSAGLAYLARRRPGHLGEQARLEACRRELSGVYTNALVVGGGTLIGHADVREAIARRLEADPAVPLFMLGSGVEDPLFHEDDRANVLEELDRWVEILRRFERLTVRGERSRELLGELGLGADAVGDPVLLVAEDRGAVADPRVLGVNLVVADRIWGNDPELLLDQIAEFGQTMVKRGLRLRFVPLWANEVPYMREVARRTGEEVELIEPSRLETTLEAIAGCGTFVGQSASSVAFASALMIPSVMLAYHPKCVELHASVGMEDFTLRTDSLLVEDLVDRVDYLREGSSQHRLPLAEHVDGMRIRLRGELDAIRSDLEARSGVSAVRETRPAEA